MSAKPEGVTASAAKSPANGSDALLALAAKCEQATGPDRELEWAIFVAVNPDKVTVKRSHRYLYDEQYTHSLDAAMTLTPAGWLRWIYDADEGRCICRIERDDESLSEIEIGANAATWPLAMAAASLRAKAASQ